MRDLLTVPSLAQLLTPGTHTLSVSGLPAKTTTAGTSAMSAWSITVIWLLPTGSAAATVQASNPGINNQSSLAGTVSVLAPAGAAVTGFWQTVWAPDPWATKTITISGVQLPGSITGRHQDPADGKRGPFRVDGFELFAAPSIPAAGATGRIEFRNVSAKTGNDRQDGLWLGPTLVLRRAG